MRSKIWNQFVQFYYCHALLVTLANHTTFVVAKEHINLMMEEWKDEEEQKRKSDLKKEKAVLMTWKKIMLGLKIIR